MFPTSAVSLVNFGVTNEFDMISCGTRAIKKMYFYQPIALIFNIPAARSRTATLLRLSPSYQPYVRQLLPQRVRPLASRIADFRDLTGGVYKPRERIHRNFADLRLLATPTSRSRVADSYPN